VELQRHLPDFSARSIRIVGVSVDPQDESRDLAKSLGLTFDLLSDPDLKVIRAYGVADESNGIAWPSEVLVDPGGAIRWRQSAQSVGKRPSAEDVLTAFDTAEK
jgi:peroxiredoxin